MSQPVELEEGSSEALFRKNTVLAPALATRIYPPPLEIYKFDGRTEEQIVRNRYY